MVCEGLTSRLDVAKELLALLGLNDTIRIAEVPSEHFAEEYFAERPESERLINKRLDDIGLNIMRNWKIALQEYLRCYYSGYVE